MMRRLFPPSACSTTGRVTPGTTSHEGTSAAPKPDALPAKERLGRAATELLSRVVSVPDRRLHGFHDYTYPDDAYRDKGDFVLGKRSGYGTLFRPDGGLEYQGQWCDDTFNGVGTIRIPTGTDVTPNNVNGDFINGKLSQGHATTSGVSTAVTVKILTGNFINGQLRLPHLCVDASLQYYADGKVTARPTARYEGGVAYPSGERHGYGRMFFSGGALAREGEWRHDEFLSPVTSTSEVRTKHGKRNRDFEDDPVIVDHGPGNGVLPTLPGSRTKINKLVKRIDEGFGNLDVSFVKQEAVAMLVLFSHYRQCGGVGLTLALVAGESSFGRKLAVRNYGIGHARSVGTLGTENLAKLGRADVFMAEHASRRYQDSLGSQRSLASWSPSPLEADRDRLNVPAASAMKRDFLRDCVEQDQVDVVGQLLRYFHFQGKRPEDYLSVALGSRAGTETSLTSMVRLLLRYVPVGAALRHAIFSTTNPQLARHLLSEGYADDLNDFLFDAISEEMNAEAVRMLIADLGVDHRAVNSNGETPLQVAESLRRVRRIHRARGSLPQIILFLKTCEEGQQE